MAKTFEQIICSQLKLGRPKIAVGLGKRDKNLEKTIKAGKKYADIVIVSDKKVPGFETVVSKEPEHKLIDLLLSKKVDGIVRGTVDDFEAFYYYCQKTGYDKNKGINPCLMQTPSGKMFFLSHCSNPEGWEYEEKRYIVSGLIEYMKKFGFIPKVALFTSVRPGSVGKNPKMDKSWYDAEKLRKYLLKKKVNAINYNIELNTAIEDNANVVVPVNGMIGNQIFRAMYVCGGKDLCAPRINMPYVYEDNSRTEKDFEPHIKFAAAWANSLKK